MKLCLLRHADAHPVGREGIDRDEDRTLTPAGVEQARRAAAALRAWGVALDAVVASPCARAIETAGFIVGDDPGGPTLEEDRCLVPGSDPGAVLRFLSHRPPSERILLVGHLPQLGELLGRLLGAGDIPIVKAGMASLTVLRLLPDPAVRFEWFVTPDQYPSVR